VSPPRRTQIIATLGPASRDPAVLRRMVEEGLDWARLNCSRDEPEVAQRAAETLRTVAAAAGRPVRLLADLGGPKVRVGIVPEPIPLEVGTEVVLGAGRAAPDAVPVTVPRAFAHLAVGEMIALDNGAIELEVIDADPGWVRCRVLSGRMIRSHQSLAIAGNDASAITDRDEEDLAAALALRVDAVALSRVRRREDATALRARLPDGVLAFAKIEDAEGLRNLDGILDAADAVVCVRGSLGFSLPRAAVPFVQKDLLAWCADRGRSGIVASELFRSMVERPTPMRVEIADVVTAMLDGAVGLVLSEESAVGAYPAEAVAELRQVIERAEDSAWFQALERGSSRPAMLE
jgi:pyruvate kinase